MGQRRLPSPQLEQHLISTEIKAVSVTLSRDDDLMEQAEAAAVTFTSRPIVGMDLIYLINLRGRGEIRASLAEDVD